MLNVLIFLLANPTLSACECRSCYSRLSSWFQTRKYTTWLFSQKTLVVPLCEWINRRAKHLNWTCCSLWALLQRRSKNITLPLPQHLTPTLTCGRALLLFLLFLLGQLRDLEEHLLQGRIDDPVTTDTEALEFLVETLEELLEASFLCLLEGQYVVELVTCLGLEIGGRDVALYERRHGRLTAVCQERTVRWVAVVVAQQRRVWKSADEYRFITQKAVFPSETHYRHSEDMTTN